MSFSTSLMMQHASYAPILPTEFGVKFYIEGQYPRGGAAGDGKVVTINFCDAVITMSYSPYSWQPSKYIRILVKDKDGITRMNFSYINANLSPHQHKVMYNSATGIMTYYFLSAESDYIWYNPFPGVSTDIGSSRTISFARIEPTDIGVTGVVSAYDAYIVGADFSTQDPTSDILFSDTFVSGPDLSKWSKSVTGSPTEINLSPGYEVVKTSPSDTLYISQINPVIIG